MSDFPDVGIAVRDLILSDSEIVALVGNRVSADRMPQGQPVPAIVFYGVSTIAFDCLGGAVGLDQTRLQFECYADTRQVAGQLANLLRVRLAGYRGVHTGVVFKGVEQSSGQAYALDRSETGSDTGRPFVRQDFTFTFNSLAKV